MEKVRDVFRLKTTKGRVLCCKSYKTPDAEVRFIAEVLIHIAEAGFGYGPSIVPARNRALWTKIDEVPYMLTEWIPGRSPNFNDRSEWKKALRALAVFHRHAEGANLSEVPASRCRYAFLQNIIECYSALIRNYSHDLSPYTSLCEEAIRYLNGPESSEAVKHEATLQAIAHGDYNYPNLVLDPQGSIHLIDFENTSLQARMTDLAHILQRNLAWKADETVRWIEYYDRFRPLSKEDRHLLFALLHVPYPLVRAIRLNKSIGKINKAMPDMRMIDPYTRRLRLIL